MPQVLIHYFTGTGNSLLAAEQLCHELRIYGYTATFHAIEDGAYTGRKVFDLHLFFFPIYATSVPHIMRKYMRNLPNGQKVKAGIIATNGRISRRIRDGYQGWALHQARLYLHLRNYDVFFSETLDYPHNITIALPPRKKQYNEEIIAQVSAKLPDIAERIVCGQRYHRKFFWPNLLWSLPFGVVFSLFGRHFFGKLMAADSKCTACGLCAQKCPGRAIALVKGQMRWHWNCEGCLRCMNICPQNAIQTSLVRVLLFVAAVVANPFYWLNKLVPVSVMQNLNGFLRTIVGVILIFICFWFMEWLIFKVSAIPVLQGLFSWGHTRFYGRYHAKHFHRKFRSL